MLAALALGLGCRAGLAPVSGIGPGERPAPLGEVPPAESCGRCHRSTHDAWAESRHARSSTNAVFQVSFAEASLRGWCLGCHAPVPALASEGVTCAVCHLRDGEILTARAPDSDPTWAHPIRVDPDFGSPRFCGTCHEFDQRDPETGQQVALLAQKTVTEWRASGDLRTCVDCHVRDHRMEGSHAVDRLRGALRVEVASAGPELLFTLSAVGVAHAVPTGDPFRRLVVESCDDPACDRPFRQRTLSRQILPGSTEGPDLRPAPGRPAVVRLPRADWWRVAFYWSDERLDPLLPPEEVSVTLASGPAPP